MNNRVVIPAMDFDSHDCHLGPDSSCAICQAKALFFKRSKEKWDRFWQRATAQANRQYQSDPAVVAAIMSPTKEEKQHANA